MLSAMMTGMFVFFSVVGHDDRIVWIVSTLSDMMTGLFGLLVCCQP